MQIRLMERTDCERAISLWRQVPGMGLNDVEDSSKGLDRFLKRNPDTCFVAEEEGELAGTILVGQDGRRAHIYHLAVREDRRGEGIAKAMIKKAQQALKEQGIGKIFLLVRKENQAGNAFWEHAGFPVREDIYYRDYILVEMEEYFT